MAVGTPTTAGGSSSTITVAVPAGAAAGDVMLFVGQADGGAATFASAPSGFTTLVNVAQTGDGGRTAVAYKRLTAGDTGNYTWAIGANTPWLGTVIPLTGRHATNDPVASASSTQNTLQASPMTVTANQVTAVAGDDIVFVSGPDVNTSGGGNGHSSWAAGYTEIVDIENTLGGGNDWCNVGVAKSENVGAGATGTKTVTFTTSAGTAGWTAWLIRVPAAAGGGGDQNITVPLVDGAPAVFSPTVSPQAVSISPGLVDSGPTVFSPTLSPGAVTVSTPLVDGAPNVFSPTVTTGAVTISPPLVDGAPVVFAPTVTRDGDAAGAATGGLPLVRAG